MSLEGFCYWQNSDFITNPSKIILACIVCPTKEILGTVCFHPLDHEQVPQNSLFLSETVRVKFPLVEELYTSIPQRNWMLQHLWETHELLENVLLSTHERKENHVGFFFPWNNCVAQLNTECTYMCRGWRYNALIVSETNSALLDGLNVAVSSYKLLVVYRHNVHK